MPDQQYHGSTIPDACLRYMSWHFLECLGSLQPKSFVTSVYRSLRQRCRASLGWLTSSGSALHCWYASTRVLPPGSVCDADIMSRIQSAEFVSGRSCRSTADWRGKSRGWALIYQTQGTVFNERSAVVLAVCLMSSMSNQSTEVRVVVTISTSTYEILWHWKMGAFYWMTMLRLVCCQLFTPACYGKGFVVG